MVIPLYPKEKCALFKPNDETEKRCQVYQRRVVLTASSGESLIWSNTVKFVIDVGVERRKVITIKSVNPLLVIVLGFLPPYPLGSEDKACDLGEGAP